MRTLNKSLLLIWLLALLSACGTDNIFKDAEEDDPAEDATIEMENGKPEKAIKILEDALKSDSENYQLISLLSAAYAQRGGVSMVDLALNMVDNAEGSSQSQNGLSALWPLLPEATASNIRDVREAVNQLRSIPADNRTDSDDFKLAVISTALASLQLKALDTNGDGELSLQELANLSEASADTIVSALLGASGALGNIDGDLGESTDTAATQINGIVADVNNANGADNAEKLSNYFRSN